MPRNTAQSNEVKKHKKHVEWRLWCFYNNTPLPDEERQLDMDEVEDSPEAEALENTDDDGIRAWDEAEDEHQPCESAEQSRVEASASNSEFSHLLDDAMWHTSSHQSEVHAQVQKSLEVCVEVIESKAGMKGEVFKNDKSRHEHSEDNDEDDAPILNELAMDVCFSPMKKQRAMKAINDSAELVKWVENDLLRESTDEGGGLPVDSPAMRADMAPRFGLTLKTMAHVEWFVRKWGVQTHPMRVNPGGNSSRRLYVCRNAACSIWGGRAAWTKKENPVIAGSSQDDSGSNNMQRRNTMTQRAEGDKELLELMQQGEENRKCCALMLFQQIDARKLITGTYAE